MSVTAVPLRPIKKRALVVLWIGIALALALAGALAWAGTTTGAISDPSVRLLAENARKKGVTVTPSGLQYEVIEAGQGPKPGDADMALIGYKGTLADGTVFDENPQAALEVARVVPGFSEGLKLMSRGAHYRFWIPPALGYGAEAQGDVIPANSVLVFEVNLLDFRSTAEIQAEMQRLQSMGALPQQQPGAPGGR